MAGAEGIEPEGVAVGRVGWLERLPARRIALWILSLLVGLAVAYGSYRTLALPADERYAAATWRDFIVLGIARGSVYALIALGYTLVYGILKMINFAHGEVFMAGAFGSFFFAQAYEQSGFLDHHVFAALGILFLVAILVSTLVAMLLERVAYRPLRNAPRLVPLITAIGASLFLQNTARGLFGPQTRGYPKPNVLDGKWHPLGIPIARTQLLTVIVAAVVMVALQFFVSRTKTGKAMRAVSEDKEIAGLMGINADRVIVTTFAVGGALAGIAGVLYGMTFGLVGPFMGFTPGIKAFTAAVLGGIGSISGAAVGGLVLGILESVGPPLFLTGVHVPSPLQLQDVIAFSILVLVLIFRPGGILGTGEAEKV